MAFDTGPGAVPATIAEGRSPVGPAEIAPNAQLLETLELEIGDEIEIGAGSRAFPASVVGRAVVPAGGETGHVAVITLDAFHRFRPDHPGDWLLVRLEQGGRIDEVVTALRASGYPVAGNLLGRAEADVSVLFGSPLDDAAEAPVLLGVLMAVAGLVVLVHLVAVASGLRRRELGILRVLGFRRRQVVGSVAALAGTLVLAAFAVGVPAGLVVGWIAWQGTADRLGVLAESVIPWAAISTALVAGLALGVVAAAWPARSAARVPTAEVLRSE
jgi:putative ABC transport system permease protein